MKNEDLGGKIKRGKGEGGSGIASWGKMKVQGRNQNGERIKNG